MDDVDTTSGSIASDGYDSYNAPEGIFHHQNNGRHWVHKMYWKLKTPLQYGTLTKQNLCNTCCRSLNGKPRDTHAWKFFVKSSVAKLTSRLYSVHFGLYIVLDKVPVWSS